MTILDKIRTVVTEHANQPFLIDAETGRVFTYRETLYEAVKKAEWFGAKGLHRGDRIAVYVPNSVEFVFVYFACLYAGITVVPLNLTLSSKERVFVLTHSGIKAAVFTGQTAELEQDILQATPHLLRLVIGDASEQTQDLSTLPDPVLSFTDSVDETALLSIHFTSGTTGQPKAVVHTVKSLFGNAWQFNTDVGTDMTHRFLHIMPMAYMAGFLNTLLCPFMAGGSVVIAPQFDARTVLHFWQPVVEYGVNTMWMSPTMLISLLRLDRSSQGVQYCQGEGNISRIFVGTAPLPLSVRQEFRTKYDVDVCESYGLSELLLLSANTGYKDRAVGAPLSDIYMQIRDESGGLLEHGQEGEIFVNTPHAAIGYLDYETLQSREHSIPEWFATGDVGCFDTDGVLYITSRKKDIIIRGGFNISPRAVEEAILKHPAVGNIAVIGLPHEFYGEEVVACVQMKEGLSLDMYKQEIIALCRNEVNTVSTPTRFIEKAVLPMSVTGKVLKAKLREEILGERTP